MALDRKHLSRPRAAWKKYYHYWRLEHHEPHVPWHGRKGARRAILTGLVIAAVIAYGVHRGWEEFEGNTDTPQIISP